MTGHIDPLCYLEPSQTSGRAFVARKHQGALVMLNLLRFRDTADYSAHLELAPPAPITGASAFQRYIEHTLPYLHDSRLLPLSELPLPPVPRCDIDA